MRHRESPTAHEALEAWKALRRKVEAEGGQQYDKPVLVRFADKGNFEVMDRDIVEDEFYVRRPYKIVRELDPKGADLEQALREQRGGPDRDRSQRGGRPGQSSRPGGGRPGQGGKPGRGNRPGPGGKPGQEGKPEQEGKPGQGGPRHRRGGRSRRGSRRGGGERSGERGGERGPRPPRPPQPPSAPPAA